jgi:hypothetical protein
VVGSSPAQVVIHFEAPMAAGISRLNGIVNKTYQENQSGTSSDSPRLDFDLQGLRPFAFPNGRRV